MAAAKASAVAFKAEESLPTEADARSVLEQMVFCTLPAPLFKLLSDAAAERQMTLAQLLSTAVSEYLKKTEPNTAGDTHSTEGKE